MKSMLLMRYGDTPGVLPMVEWAPEDARARGEAMMAIQSMCAPHRGAARP